MSGRMSTCYPPYRGAELGYRMHSDLGVPDLAMMEVQGGGTKSSLW
jgi:hypothetical protein